MYFTLEEWLHSSSFLEKVLSFYLSQSTQMLRAAEGDTVVIAFLDTFLKLRTRTVLNTIVLLLGSGVRLKLLFGDPLFNVY